MNKKDEKSVKKLIEYCDMMMETVEYFGNDEDIFKSNIFYQNACSFIIMQIGDYVNRLSDEFLDAHPEIPWSEIIGMRIIHAHHYESVIDEIVWETIQNDIPYFRDYLEKLI